MYRRWDKSKPATGPFTLNRDCPQAQGLAAWWPMAGAAARGYIPDLAGQSHLAGASSGLVLGDVGQPALQLAQASSQFVESAVLPATGVPLTLTAWGKPDSSTQTPIWIGDIPVGAIANGNIHRIVLVSGKVRANSGVSPSTESNAITTASYNAGEWNLFGATFASNTSRTVYLNGGNSVTDTTNIATGALSSVILGAARTVVGSGSIFQFFNGPLGECGVWNIALSADIHARLYNPGTRFELWYPLRSRKWIVIGGGTSISGAIGVASASGFAGNVNANRTVAGSLGTATATGFKGNVNANRTIAGSLGVAVASGFQGTVTGSSSDTTIAGNLGTAVASGFTGGVNANTTIAGNLGVADASGFTGGVSNGETTTVKIGGDDGFERQRIEVYEPRRKPKRRDEELDTALKAAFNKVMGREDVVLATVEAYDEEEDELEVLLALL